MSNVPDGMVTLWVILKTELNGDSLIDDLVDTIEEAHDEVERRGGYPWHAQEITVPYRNHNE